MDFLTALATIIQLVGLYRQEVGQRQNLSSEEFMGWLEAHRHTEIKKLISETFHLQHQVNLLLREDHAKIQSQLESLSSLIMALVTRFDSLAPMAVAAAEQTRLPAQALDILTSVVKHQGTGFELLPMRAGLILVLIPSGQTFGLTEPEFAEEDCEALCSIGYLANGHSRSGNPRYTLTRAGRAFGQSILDRETQEPS